MRLLDLVLRRFFEAFREVEQGELGASPNRSRGFRGRSQTHQTLGDDLLGDALNLGQPRVGRDISRKRCVDELSEDLAGADPGPMAVEIPGKTAVRLGRFV